MGWIQHSSTCYQVHMDSCGYILFASGLALGGKILPTHAYRMVEK
jgi:hypothetical protein